MASNPRKYLLTSSTLSSNNGNTEACYMCFVCPDYCANLISPSPPQFPPPQKYEISPILMIMLCILGAIFLLFSYLISRCRNSTHDHQVLSDHQPASWSIETTGLPWATIESMGEVSYKRGEAVGMLPADCYICLSEFEEEERLRVLTKCGHAFHVACIDTWLMSHTNCPVCRTQIEDNHHVSSDEQTQLILPGDNMGLTSRDHVVIILNHEEDFADKRLRDIIRRSVSVDFLHDGISPISRRQQIKRSSSFTR